ncbi:glycosyltransferase [Candidatus Peribacteria bacterium]|jgi:glycosyltransferase involved in cell wall biosynthesis|nr:glycosyltransferase [Candidatus Peribacteria bacterium]MBT4020752.1 glycosyltransferase [Candidatus Peribacteria bacterium]MBT4241033.1 glycosyltransferase [Candidatus Peribacteria bacterium]MBT4474469.1 glycosyltransferase [Candidatus Peribacteria bacterium]
MRVALVHELLTMRGGAERLFKTVSDMFPEAPIYTLLYDKKKLGDWFSQERIITSKLQKFAFSYNHHLYLRRFPKAIESFDFSDFDVVISSSSAFAHGIITKGRTKHICYVNSPARYLWDRTHDVIDKANTGILGPIKKKYLENTFHKLRQWDCYAADRPDVILSASKEVQKRVELYWRRESEVVYPCVDDFWLAPEMNNEKCIMNNFGKYFLIVSTLVPYKRIEIAIEACEKAGASLKIVGEGPDKKRLMKLAGNHTEFLGYKTHEEVRDLYTNAKATLFPGEEDFGLVPLESMSCGTPVIAYEKGGALETILENQTGEFFQDPDQLELIIKNFDKTKFDPQACKNRAQEFSRDRFEEGIRSAIAKA